MLETSDGEPVMLGWPEGYSVDGEGDDAVILDSDGQQIAGVGDDVRLGGGPISATELTAEVGSDLPERCRTDHSFAVASVIE
ncbi:MAG: hypothetical protein ACRDKF_16940 [Actinomycetota bacterium]